MSTPGTLELIDKRVVSVLKWISVAVFLIITLIMTAEIFLTIASKIAQRFDIKRLSAFISSIAMNWSGEIIEMLFAALVFYGSAAVWIGKGHFSAGDWISKRLKAPRAKSAFKLLLDLLSFAFILVILMYSIKLVSLAREESTTLLISKKVFYLCMPVSAGIMALYSVKFIVFNLIGVIQPSAPGATEEPGTEQA